MIVKLTMDENSEAYTHRGVRMICREWVHYELPGLCRRHVIYAEVLREQKEGFSKYEAIKSIYWMVDDRFLLDGFEKWLDRWFGGNTSGILYVRFTAKRPRKHADH